MLQTQQFISLENKGEHELWIHCSQKLTEDVIHFYSPNRYEEKYAPTKGLRRLIAALFMIEPINRIYVERYLLRITFGKACVYDLSEVERECIGSMLDHAFDSPTHLSGVELLRETKKGQIQLKLSTPDLELLPEVPL